MKGQRRAVGAVIRSRGEGFRTGAAHVGDRHLGEHIEYGRTAEVLPGHRAGRRGDGRRAPKPRRARRADVTAHREPRAPVWSTNRTDGHTAAIVPESSGKWKLAPHPRSVLDSARATDHPALAGSPRRTRRMDQPAPADGDRRSARGEPHPSRAAGRPTDPVHRRTASPAGGRRKGGRQKGAPRPRRYRHPGHHPGLASEARRSQMGSTREAAQTRPASRG